MLATGSWRATIPPAPTPASGAGRLTPASASSSSSCDGSEQQEMEAKMVGVKHQDRGDPPRNKEDHAQADLHSVGQLVRTPSATRSSSPDHGALRHPGSEMGSSGQNGVPRSSSDVATPPFLTRKSLVRITPIPGSAEPARAQKIPLWIAEPYPAPAPTILTTRIRWGGSGSRPRGGRPWRVTCRPLRLPVAALELFGRSGAGHGTDPQPSKICPHCRRALSPSSYTDAFCWKTRHRSG